MKSVKWYPFFGILILASSLVVRIEAEEGEILTTETTSQDNITPKKPEVDIRSADDSEPNCYVAVNIDDDDSDEQWDREQANMQVEDDDLIQLIVTTNLQDGDLDLNITNDLVRIRLWADKKKSVQHENTWEVVDGKIVSAPGAPTNESGTEGYVYVEGITWSLAWNDQNIEVKVRQTECVDDIDLTVVEVDLDIDTNNNDNFSITSDSSDEDQIEMSDEEDDYGKLIVFGRARNTDGDLVADIADGFNIQQPLNAAEYINVESDYRFVPVIVWLRDPFEPNDTEVEFEYEWNNPANSLADGVFLSPFESLATNASDGVPYTYEVKRPGLRMWTKDGDKRTSGAPIPQGEYVPSETAIAWNDIRADSPADYAILYLEYVDKTPAEISGRTVVKVKTRSISRSIEAYDEVEANLLSITPSAEKIFTLSGNALDVVPLKVQGVPNGAQIEWSLSMPDPAFGSFSSPNAEECNFSVLKSGSNTLQLKIDNVLVWEREIISDPIKSRNTWNAVDPVLAKLSSIDKNGDPYYPESITFHHSSNNGSGPDEVKRIQNLHMGLFPYNLPGTGGRDYGDIGYHFLIDADGTVYQGRDPEGAPGAVGGPYVLGSHVELNNTDAGIGVCLLGDFENNAFTEARRKSLEKTVTGLCRRFDIDAIKVSYHKHRTVNGNVTACPGANCIAKEKEIFQSIYFNLQ